MASLSAMIRSPIVTNVIVYHHYNVTDVPRHLLLSWPSTGYHRLGWPPLKTASAFKPVVSYKCDLMCYYSVCTGHDYV